MVRRVTDEFGRIDVFFANAGIREKSFVLIHEKPIEDWDEVMDADLRAVFLQMKAVFPVMMEGGRGSFITTSSVGGMWPLAQDKWVYTQTAYAVAKAGLIMLTKAAARQYGSYGIRVNTICPGYHRTPLTPADEVEGVERTIARLLPLGRCGMPEEMKGLAVWLASDASSFVTGQILIEDGGYLA
jgi:NAD(P)-dependent dehydrogenase (short-subunit alcohol dehydrogenase family)